MTLLLGNSLERLRELPDNSVDACVTDPPYGLAFMNKKWDYDVPSVDLWRQVFRVMKPGAHLLSFGGTRTYHRMVVAIEDAGFEIRDQIMWIYGSGFPKSLDVSKAIDKAAGAEREVIGSFKATGTARNSKHIGAKTHAAMGDYEADVDRIYQTAPSTALAKQWQGWGTALKPANEPIVLARKPLEKGLTVAQNVQKWGTGAINVDAGRIGTAADMNPSDFDDSKRTSPKFSGKFNNGEIGEYRARTGAVPNGRWPANVLFDEEAAEMLDEQSGESKSTVRKPNGKQLYAGNALLESQTLDNTIRGIQDSGGASRFFYVAKASKRERNAGLEGIPLKDGPGSKRSSPAEGQESALGAPRANHHPTVKPIKLMEYLCKLITPPGGVILDPFLGSGSTLAGAARLGFRGIGIERESEYLEIARKRIEHWESGA